MSDSSNSSPAVDIPPIGEIIAGDVTTDVDYRAAALRLQTQLILQTGLEYQAEASWAQRMADLRAARGLV